MKALKLGVMKTAIDYYAEQSMKLEIDKLKGKISLEEMLNKLTLLVQESKLIEKEQLRTMHLVTWMNKDLDFDNYYFETYENERSNTND
jgi:hypothetical protein